MPLNIQFGASNVRGFNAEANSQGPSVAEIRKVEVQKDTSTNPNPVHQNHRSLRQTKRAPTKTSSLLVRYRNSVLFPFPILSHRQRTFHASGTVERLPVLEALRDRDNISHRLGV